MSAELYVIHWFNIDKKELDLQYFYKEGLHEAVNLHQGLIYELGGIHITSGVVHKDTADKIKFKID